MAGRRRRGNAAAGAMDLVTELLYEDRKFQREAKLKAIEMEKKLEMDKKLKEYEAWTKGEGSYDAMGNFVPNGGLGGNPNNMLVGAQEHFTLMRGVPGEPYPSDELPVNPKSRNTIQAAMRQGNFESPAATVGEGVPADFFSMSGLDRARYLNSRETAEAPPEAGGLGNRLMQGLSGLPSAIGGGIGRGLQGLSGIGSSMSGAMSAPRLDSATASIIEDIESGDATVEEFLDREGELRMVGVDTEAVKSYLGI